MIKNYEVIDKLVLVDKHYVTVRQRTDSPLFLVELYYRKRFSGELHIQLAECWCFGSLDEALECFCRFLPNYEPECLEYGTLLEHNEYSCKQYISSIK